MKPSPLYFLLLFFTNSCQNTINNKSAPLVKNIVAQWGSLHRERPTLDITEDSIYYFGSNKSYPYKMEGKDLVMVDNGVRVRLTNVRLSDDTMLFESPPGYEIAAIRFKTYYPH